MQRRAPSATARKQRESDLGRKEREKKRRFKNGIARTKGHPEGEKKRKSEPGGEAKAWRSDLLRRGERKNEKKHPGPHSLKPGLKTIIGGFQTSREKTGKKT